MMMGGFASNLSQQQNEINQNLSYNCVFIETWYKEFSEAHLPIELPWQVCPGTIKGACLTVYPVENYRRLVQFKKKMQLQ